MSATPLILGHRGASALAPENTLAAFSRAMADGADGIEFDVRLSRDNVAVVIHDASLKRTTGDNRLVCDLTADELGRIDVGSWFNTKLPATDPPFVNEKLPTLAQVFDLFSTNSGVLYVEMKCERHEANDLAQAVASEIRKFTRRNRVVVESFDLDAITAVKTIDGEIRTAALFEPRFSRPVPTIRRLKMIDMALETGAEEIALHHALASPGVIDKALTAGMDVVVWTVDNNRWITRARSLGIKALIANNPAALIKARDAWHNSPA
jgi:glycerophosphoryl diester phosphodiesterase